MNPNMETLFDSLQDGLLIVSATGKTAYANPAALAALQATHVEEIAPEWLQSQIAAIRSGYLKPPLTFEIELPRQSEHAALMRVTLLPSPAGGRFMVVIKDITAARLYENAIRNLAEMLHSEFNAPMRDFLTAVSGMRAEFELHADGNWPLQDVVAGVSRKAASLEEVLGKISLLASTHKWSPMRGDDRIPVKTLVDEALLETKSLLARRQIRVMFCGLDDRLPVIYGSRLFLSRALAGYLAHMVERIGPGVNILISAKSSGNVVLLTVTNYGETIPDKGIRAMLPLPDAAGSKPLEALNLTLSLCKRVVELHGGSLRLVRENGKVGSIVFELPVGAPARLSGDSCSECSIALQAMQFARDLAEIMTDGRNPRPLGKQKTS
jgi:signal transduction histidine kinase